MSVYDFGGKFYDGAHNFPSVGHSSLLFYASFPNSILVGVPKKPKKNLKGHASTQCASGKSPF